MHKIAQTHRHAHTAMCFIPLPCRIDKCWRDEDDCSRAGPGIDWYDMPQDNCGRQFRKQLGQAPPVPVIRLCIAKNMHYEKTTSYPAAGLLAYVFYFSRCTTNSDPSLHSCHCYREHAGCDLHWLLSCLACFRFDSLKASRCIQGRKKENSLKELGETKFA